MSMETLDRDGIEKLLGEIDGFLTLQRYKGKIPIYLNKSCSKAVHRKRMRATGLEFYAGKDGELDLPSRCALHRALIGVEGNSFVWINDDAEQPEDEYEEEELDLGLAHLEVHVLLSAREKLRRFLKPPYHPIDRAWKMVDYMVHQHSGS